MNDSKIINKWYRGAVKSFVRYIASEEDDDYEYFMRMIWGEYEKLHSNGKENKKFGKLRLIDTDISEDKTFVVMLLEVISLRVRRGGEISREQVLVNCFRVLSSRNKKSSVIGGSVMLIDTLKDSDKKLSLLKVFHEMLPDVLSNRKQLCYNNKDEFIQKCLNRLNEIDSIIQKDKVRITKPRIDLRGGSDLKIYLRLSSRDEEFGLSPKMSRKVVGVLKLLKHQESLINSTIPLESLSFQLKQENSKILRNQIASEQGALKLNKREWPLTVDKILCMGTPLVYLNWHISPKDADAIIVAWDKVDSGLRIKK